MEVRDRSRGLCLYGCVGKSFRERGRAPYRVSLSFRPLHGLRFPSCYGELDLAIQNTEKRHELAE